MKTLLEEIIPMVDANYRTLADQQHRAMAGLSMGGMQTRVITLANPDVFAYVGMFSGGSISTEDVANAPGFKEKIKLVFISYGSRELENPRPGFGDKAKENTDKLKEAGLNTHFYVSPQTAHEWQSWRRSLYQFAPLLFNSKINHFDAEKNIQLLQHYYWLFPGLKVSRITVSKALETIPTFLLK